MKKKFREIKILLQINYRRDLILIRHCFRFRAKAQLLAFREDLIRLMC